MSDPKVESYSVTDPHAPDGERTISAVVARLVQSDSLDALAKIEAAVAAKRDAIAAQNSTFLPVEESARERMHMIARANVQNAVECYRLLSGRASYDPSDIAKTDRIFAILAE